VNFVPAFWSTDCQCCILHFGPQFVSFVNCIVENRLSTLCRPTELWCAPCLLYVPNYTCGHYFMGYTHSKLVSFGGCYL
jgi:hypothetical protein